LRAVQGARPERQSAERSRCKYWARVSVATSFDRNAGMRCKLEKWLNHFNERFSGIDPFGVCPQF